MRSFWRLDITSTNLQGEVLDAWPEPARYFAVSASVDEAFYLIGGIQMDSEDENTSAHRYLMDAYWYSPGPGWEQLADLHGGYAYFASSKPRVSPFIIAGMPSASHTGAGASVR